VAYFYAEKVNQVMWPQQAQAQVHQQAQAHIKAQSLEAWWERFT